MRRQLNNNFDEYSRLLKLVCRFRLAIDKAKKDDMFVRHKRFKYFPRGCCDDACYLLSQYLLEMGYDCKVIIGSHYEDSVENNGKHAWIKTFGGYVVDITIDQFTGKHLYDCVYVGQESDIHKYYSDKIELMNPGINQYSQEWRRDMQNLYCIVKDYICNKIISWLNNTTGFNWEEKYERTGSMWFSKKEDDRP